MNTTHIQTTHVQLHCTSCNHRWTVTAEVVQQHPLVLDYDEKCPRCHDWKAEVAA
jgi:Zn finger protein HypA/HybF involved in hydrogenase expression